MDKEARVYVAGHTGLVGSAITSTLVNKGYRNLITRSYQELDLINQKAVDDFFHDERPDYVILAAAMVGGILANNIFRADFIYNNIMIQSNVIHACWKYGVKKLLFLGSTCIYPKDAPQPLKEEYLLTLPLEQTNEPYAIAKIAGLKMCESFNRQYGTNFISVMPTNLYGPADNFDLERSHVLPALLRKMHLAKCLEKDDWAGIRKDLAKNPLKDVYADSSSELIITALNEFGVRQTGNNNRDQKGTHLAVLDNKSGGVEVTVWGTGTPMREFMYSPDMAEACVFVMEHVDVTDIIRLNQPNSIGGNSPPHFLNIGTGSEIFIKDLAIKIKEVTGFKGNIVFDSRKPDGPSRKATDSSIINQLGFRHRYGIDEGLADLYRHYLS